MKGFVNMETGEFVENVTTARKRPPTHKPIRVDGLFLSETHNADVLVYVVSQYDDYVASGKCRTFCDHAQVVNAVAKGNITHKQLMLLQALIERLTAWNHVVCDVNELMAACGLLRNNLSRELNTPYLRVLSNKNGSLHITISPVLAWKGNMALRGAAIANWYFASNLMQK